MELDKSEFPNGERAETRNKRSVWTVTTQPFADAHFATYPPDLIKPCILAGSKPGDTILDPFAGSGTTGMVAIELGRKAILIELNSEYVKLINQRCLTTPGLALV
jgi:DNA modification methylase